MHLIDFCFIMQIGNAVINDETDERGIYDYLGTHAIISDQDLYQIQKYCNFSPNASTQPRECNVATEAAGKDLQRINLYNIYAPLCSSPNITAQPKKASVS